MRDPTAAEASLRTADGSSFRDPSGFIYTHDGVLYRQVNPAGQDAYALLRQSGLYDALVSARLLIGHDEVPLHLGANADARVVLRPERIPFISYPYEWCFRQLQDAALATLHLQREALRFNLSLKDASAYNIQFRQGSQPIHIDTLSFEPYREGTPWVAYRQFCQHFLAPLALVAHAEVRLGNLLRVFLDGIPVDVAARLLPLRDRFSASLLPHIFLHSTAQKRHGGSKTETPLPAPAEANGNVSKTALLGLLDSLEAGIRQLAWKPGGTEWGDYYDNTNYDDAAFAAKKQLVAELLAEIAPAPSYVFDLGANTGLFSRIAAERGLYTVSLDIDPAAVEKNYRHCRAPGGPQNLLPLVQDLTNPSPDLGWALSERQSLLRRCAAAGSDASSTAAFALALIHHLAISNNVPLARVADFFAAVSPHLILEWVPKEDSQVRRLLATRPDIFPDYTQAGLEAAFAARFRIESRTPIPGTARTLYRFRRLPD